MSLLYSNSKQMSSTSTSCLVVCSQPLSRTLSIIYADTPKCDQKYSLIFQGSTKGEALGGLVVLPVPKFFVYQILGILQRCDHKLAVLTEGDFEQSAF